MSNHTFLLLEEIDSKNYRKLIAEISTINPGNVDDHLATLPAIYGYYAGLLAEAKEEMETINLNIEQVEAEVRRKTRMALKTQGSKITEKILDAETYVDQSYVFLKADLIRATTKFNLVRNILTTLEYKKDMLIQLSVNARQEKKMFT